jgi:hypothetical protein
MLLKVTITTTFWEMIVIQKKHRGEDSKMAARGRKQKVCLLK